MVADGAARPLILVVDDYEDAREMYAECLDASGFDVAQAESGVEAVAKALALQPAVIVMDLALPGMDGWSATRAIKTDARTAAIPVVALTGHARSDASAAARDAGCDAFLTKPCLPGAVVDIVRRLLAQATGCGLQATGSGMASPLARSLKPEAGLAGTSDSSTSPAHRAPV